MNDWLIEKTENTVRGLAYLSSYIKNLRASLVNENLHQIDEIESTISSILHNATKVYSYACDVDNWTTKDARLVQENGIDGFEVLQVQYAQKSETRKRIIEREKAENINLFLSKIKPLLSYSERHNKTLFFEALQELKIQTNNFFKDITDPIFNKFEQVSLNDLDWNIFCVEIEYHIDSLKDQHSDITKKISEML